ncbi:MAG: VanZ family protein [Eubacterium sp.]|nr:VanZ family protein [Eubacterium sp.]MCM1303821.1 VanZ family protein [Butyrivibrio sp.]MCM1342863.1 VanZ family protein [Muribaculaceae bacterium]MCM1410490.1 VanZ family protein [Lachnospiraceae bacterium]
MKRTKKKHAIAILFLSYLAVLLRITVFRSGFGTHGFCRDGVVNPDLFAEYIPLIRTHDWDRFLYLFAGNIVWFMPLGVYVRYRRAERGVLRAAVFGFALSLLIEAMQYVFGTGISELDDLILNTAGAALGALLYMERKQNCGRESRGGS